MNSSSGVSSLTLLSKNTERTAVATTENEAITEMIITVLIYHETIANIQAYI